MDIWRFHLTRVAQCSTPGLAAARRSVARSRWGSPSGAASACGHWFPSPDLATPGSGGWGHRSSLLRGLLVHFCSLDSLLIKCLLTCFLAQCGAHLSQNWFVMSCHYKSQGFYFHRRLVEAATGVFTGSPYGAVDVPPELWGPQGALLK